MDKMSKNEILFVRACKVLEPEKRLRSLYRRRYISDGSPNNHHIASILISICDKYLNISLLEIVSDFSPDNQWRFNNSETDVDHSLIVLKIFLNKIRLSSVSNYPNFVSPYMFRNIK